MPTQEEMKAVLRAYVDGFANDDAESVIALFAEDAVVEDPVGTPEKRGLEEIGKFYRDAVASGAKLTLDGPPRGSQGNGAAMAFTIDLPALNLSIKAVDVFTFDDAGKIAVMRAYWGPDDMKST
ncbi:nuclear transport factor 2 family protein [Actinocorallia sp. A-T 12471]|uniref:nuclear transport factor 2 family protein n=1 Tax=Actinocorallia sp. A-T 12471 TaxID=3089813 RepID=UPI0029CFA22D|nr:nuclear transport factor 2 family protein [Actinocorallia sp. A-T 12471]MDX6739883.1 nuclear transport factor 2 family protein [Actinocorallia sp. A-T 12471]